MKSDEQLSQLSHPPFVDTAVIALQSLSHLWILSSQSVLNIAHHLGCAAREEHTCWESLQLQIWWSPAYQHTTHPTLPFNRLTIESSLLILFHISIIHILHLSVYIFIYIILFLIGHQISKGKYPQNVVVTCVYL